MTNKSLLLVIDDEPIVHHTLDALLDESQFELLPAMNGEDGLELAEQQLPDIILLDVMMPGMDGYQVCRSLRRHSRLADVPIIMLTALDDRDSRLAGLAVGADDFLTKPFDGLEMQIRLRNLSRLNRFGRLAAERARFSWIVEQAEDGYLLLDVDGNIQFANTQAQNLLHLSGTYQVIDFVSWVEKFYIPQPTEKWDFWLAAPAPLYFVHPESPHSRPFWLLVEALDAPGSAESGRVVHLRDVTEKMSVYHDTRKFHTAVTHKLRTPISLIYGAMSLLEARLDQIPPDEVKPVVLTAWKGAQRLVDTVRDVLTYLDAPLTLKIGPLANLAEFAALVDKTAGMYGLENVKLSLPTELQQTTVVLTSFSLELILEELLENSQKFHPHHAPRIEIDIERVDKDQIRFRFKDDGLTLTAEQLSWVWLPYFQGEKYFSGEAPGMGLGFPTVATLVWQAGGQIRLANAPGGPGILVELTVPLVTTQEER